MSVIRDVLFRANKTEISAVVTEEGYITLLDGANTISELSLIPADEAKRVIEILENAVYESQQIRGEE